MELAVPAIAGQAGVLRRDRSTALDGGEILREDDAPLQFGRMGIGAARQVDRAAAVPEVLPVPLRGGLRLVRVRQLARRILASERQHERQRRSGRRARQHVLVRLLGIDVRRAFPAEGDDISRIVELPMKVESRRPAAQQPGLMRFGTVPVFAANEILAGIGKGDAHRELPQANQRRLDADGQQVQLGMAARAHQHRLAQHAKSAREQPAIQIQRLLRVENIFRPGQRTEAADQPQTHARQVEPMRIGAATRRPPGRCHHAASDMAPCARPRRRTFADNPTAHSHWDWAMCASPTATASAPAWRRARRADRRRSAGP